MYLCVLYAFSARTCGRTNESLTFPVNCGFMVYRRTAETFYCPAMRDNAALTAECPRPKWIQRVHARRICGKRILSCFVFRGRARNIESVQWRRRTGSVGLVDGTANIFVKIFNAPQSCLKSPQLFFFFFHGNGNTDNLLEKKIQDTYFRYACYAWAVPILKSILDKWLTKSLCMVIDSGVSNVCVYMPCKL